MWGKNRPPIASVPFWVKGKFARQLFLGKNKCGELLCKPHILLAVFCWVSKLWLLNSEFVLSQLMRVKLAEHKQRWRGLSHKGAESGLLSP